MLNNQAQSFWIFFCFLNFAYPDNCLANEGISYQVEIAGLEDDSLADKLLQYSTTEQQKEHLPKSLFTLENRAEKDIPTFLKILRSEAYYQAQIKIESQQQDADAEIIFQIDSGEQYRIHAVNIKIHDAAVNQPTLEEIGLQAEQAALTQSILDAEQQLLTYVKNQAYPFAELCKRKVIVNHDLQQMNVDFCVNAGEQIHIGEVSFTGNDNIESDFLADYIQWQSGTLYNQDQLNGKRLKLINSRLFTTARMHLAKNPDAQGHHPVSFELTERLPRTISTGLRLTTDEELFLLRFAWEHRNLWGRGEALEAELNISMIKSSLKSSFRKPAIYAPKNTLVIDAEITREDTDAYESMRAEFIAAIEHQIDKKMRINAGLGYRFSRVTEENEDTENFSLVSLPVRFSWDYSDNFLEPTAGGRLWVDFVPFWNMNSSKPFLKQKIRYNQYLSLTEADDLIWASRIIVGNIIGSSIDDVPADLRFYAGGGDTIRGYSFQSVSPTDTDGLIHGGRSLLTLSTELRGWITDTIGLVAFVDAGRAFANEYQDFNDPLQIGAGLGARYKTPIGAVRLDVARPVNKREQDDEFQFYISIGQTF